MISNRLPSEIHSFSISNHSNATSRVAALTEVNTALGGAVIHLIVVFPLSCLISMKVCNQHSNSLLR